jgi:hypothetical protein
LQAGEDADFRRMGKQPGDLPTGVLVGTVEITNWSQSRGGTYRWHLAWPKHLRTRLVPRRQPIARVVQPILSDSRTHPTQCGGGKKRRPEGTKSAYAPTPVCFREVSFCDGPATLWRFAITQYGPAVASQAAQHILNSELGAGDAVLECPSVDTQNRPLMDS